MQIDLGEFVDLILGSIPIRNGKPRRYMRAKRFILTPRYLKKMRGKVVLPREMKEWEEQIPDDAEFIESGIDDDDSIWLVFECIDWPLLRNPSIVDIPIAHTFE